VGTNLDFIWHHSVDPDVSDTVRYALHLKGSALDTTLAGLTDSAFSWGIVSLLQPRQTYRWTVTASDGHGSVASPDTFSFYADQATGVKDGANRIPKVYALHQNYPNPFNPTTNVQFDLPRAATVTLIVYNILGQEIAKLVNHEWMEAGYKTLMFDASMIPSGVYLYRISAEETGGNRYVSVKKMTLVK
jgi:type IX secretion system substrate protein